MPATALQSVVLALLLCLTAGAQVWQALFDGKSLNGWRETPFTGRAPVRVENGAIILAAGKPMTGITFTGSFPRVDYEVRLEAARLQGSDFFASMTFPYLDSYCTWVLGGWGGDIVGLSSIDGWDAADNETRTYFEFDPGRWYALRLQVTADRIRAWIDDKPVVNVEVRGRSVSLRHGEIKLSAPFGFASYATTGGLRKIEYRRLTGVAGTGRNSVAGYETSRGLRISLPAADCRPTPGRYPFNVQLSRYLRFR